ncbi:MAG: hypothetical protein ABH874_04610 [Methanobacteriota archaeon]
MAGKVVSIARSFAVIVLLFLFIGCAGAPPTPTTQPTVTPPTTAPSPEAQSEQLSKVIENPSVYGGQKITLTGQTFLSRSPPQLLVNGRSGVNLEGDIQNLKRGFYALEGIYDSQTNTLKVERIAEFKIDCNVPIETGKKVIKELVCVKVEGLIATPPKIILDELNAFISIPNTPIEKLKIYPYVVYTKDGIYLVLSDHFSILPTEFTVEYGGVTYHLYFSAGEIQGTLVKTRLEDIKAKFREKLGERGFDPKEFKGIVIANSIKPLTPIQTTVKEVNNNPSNYALKRVKIDSSYIVTTARIDYGEEEKVKVPFSLGMLTDKFTDFYEKDSKLRLEAIDPERNVWQFRKAKIIGTVLYPSEEVLKYLDYSVPLTKQQIKDQIKPALIVDTLVDDVVQLSEISELNPLTGKPSKYWNKVVEFEGYALGANVPVVKYAEEAIKRDIPVEVNIMAVGIANPKEIKTRLDLQQKIPAIAIIGLNNELIEKTEIITGKYKFKIAVSEMPKELINYENLKGFDTAFFLLEKKFLAGPEQLIYETLPTITPPPTTTPPPETPAPTPTLPPKPSFP